MKADTRQQSRFSCLKVKWCSYFETNKIQVSMSYVEAIWKHVLQDTIINGEHLWTILDIDSYSNVSHLGWRMEASQITLKADQPNIISVPSF